MQGQILAGWEARHTRLWGRHVVELSHALVSSAGQAPPASHTASAGCQELVSDTALEWLISRVEAGQRVVLEPGRPGTDAAGLGGGRRLLELVEERQLWVAVSDPGRADARHEALLETIAAEISARTGQRIDEPRAMLHVAGPRVRVPMHASLDLDSLWVLRGSVDVRLWDAAPPFLDRSRLRSALVGGRTSALLREEHWHREHSRLVHLEAGRLVAWPLMSPLAIETGDAPVVMLSLGLAGSDAVDAARSERAGAVLPRFLGGSGEGHERGALARRARALAAWLLDQGDRARPAWPPRIDRLPHVRTGDWWRARDVERPAVDAMDIAAV